MGYWVQLHKSPVVYRYIDWSITVPLQMIEFNLILKAAKTDISSGGFWRLLIGTVLMLTFGYIGETTPGFGWPGFILACAAGASSSSRSSLVSPPRRPVPAALPCRSPSATCA